MAILLSSHQHRSHINGTADSMSLLAACSSALCVNNPVDYWTCAKQRRRRRKRKKRRSRRSRKSRREGEGEGESIDE